jgi:hypothetical protein
MKRTLLALLVTGISCLTIQGVFAQQNVLEHINDKTYYQLKVTGQLGNYTPEQLMELQRTNPGYQTEQETLPPPTDTRDNTPPVTTQAQVVSAGPDTSICMGPSVTLSASAPTIVTTNITNDDQWSSVINVPFTFTFWGTSYTQCIVSSNGEIGFNISNANGFSSWGIPGTQPSVNPTDVQNTICGTWNDLYPPSGGTVRYATNGVSPNRIFVVEYCNLALFSCGTSQGLYTAQYQLFEGTNVIEVHITNKPICTGWQGGVAIESVQNPGGTMANVVGGRNATQWTTTNDANRWTWNGSSYTISSIAYAPIGTSSSSITWYLNGSPVGTGSTLTVTPNAAGTYNYIAEMTQSWCGGTFVYTDTATVTVTSPLAAPTSSGTQICANTFTTLTGNCGGNCQWYDAPSGGNFLGVGNYTTPVLTSTQTYYVQYQSGACTSPRTAVTVTVGSMAVTTTSPFGNCPDAGVPGNFTSSYSGASYSDVTINSSSVPSSTLFSGGTCNPDPNGTCANGTGFRAANVVTPANVGTLTSVSIQSVSFTVNHTSGTDTVCGADLRAWLRSPAGTLIKLTATRPNNTPSNSCYCPTFTPAGTDGTVPNTTAAYNLSNYRPETGALGTLFVGENPYATNAYQTALSYPAGSWILYVSDSVGTGGCTNATALNRITAFNIKFRTYPPVTLNWAAGSPCNSYLTNNTSATPTFTPPSGNYSCSYTLTVTDGLGCSGTSTVTVGCAPLPVELLSYTGKNTIHGNRLDWITSTEINNDHFTIERSNDGTAFVELITVPSKAINGNSTLPISYSIIDSDVKPGIYYYRLKQTDIDGSNKYAGTVAVNVRIEKDILTVIPNPAFDLAQVNYDCETDENAILKMYDHNGALVASKEVSCTKGQNTVLLDLSGKEDGIYIIAITTGDNVYKAKLVKSH